MDFNIDLDSDRHVEKRPYRQGEVVAILIFGIFCALVFHPSVGVVVTVLLFALGNIKGGCGVNILIPVAFCIVLGFFLYAKSEEARSKARDEEIFGPVREAEKRQSSRRSAAKPAYTPKPAPTPKKPETPFEFLDHATLLKAKLQRRELDVDELYSEKGSAKKQTLLHKAIEVNGSYTIGLLLENGARIDLPDSEGVVAAKYLRDRLVEDEGLARELPAEVLVDIAKIGYPVDRGTLIREMRAGRPTPEQFMELLKVNQVDVDGFDPDGKPLLLHAFESPKHRQQGYIRALLDYGASLTNRLSEVSNERGYNRSGFFPGWTVFEAGLFSNLEDSTLELMKSRFNEKELPAGATLAVDGVKVGDTRDQVEALWGAPKGSDAMNRYDRFNLDRLKAASILKWTLQNPKRFGISKERASALLEEWNPKEYALQPNDELLAHLRSRSLTVKLLPHNAGLASLQEVVDSPVLEQEEECTVIYIWDTPKEESTTIYGVIHTVKRGPKFVRYGNLPRAVEYDENDRVEKVYGRRLHLGKQQFLTVGKKETPGWRTPKEFKELLLTGFATFSKRSVYEREGLTVTLYEHQPESMQSGDGRLGWISVE